MVVHQRLLRSQLIDAVRLTLAVVLLAALALRLFGLNWDQGQYLHPDERYIVDYVMIGRLHLEWPLPIADLLDPGVSGLNPRSNDPETGEPRSFAYGTLPLFVIETAAEAVTRITGNDWHARERVYLLGRFFSALLDTGTVLLTFLIARTLATRRVALLAAMVAAFAPLSIQLAHFFTTDSWLTFFVALCLLWSIAAARSGSWRWFAAAGLALGLALATKGSVFALAAVIGIAVLVDAVQRWKRGGSLPMSILRMPERVGIAALAAIVAFAIFEPYALVRPGTFWSSFQEQADIHRGYIDVPFTRQYVGTVPVIYHIEQLVRWGFGPVSGVLALLGLVALVARAFRRDASPALILLTWLGAYGVVIFLPESKFIRYLAPLAPVLAITAALALDRIWALFTRLAGRLTGAVVAAGLIAGIALWSLAFSSIYAGDQPRIAASSWLYANAPAGSVLSTFVWDDALPLGLGPGLNVDDRQYQIESIDIYQTGPTTNDLRVVGDALLADAGTSEIGLALQDGNYQAAERMLDAGPPAPVDAASLAAALDAASRRISPVARDLQSATASLATTMLPGSTADPTGSWAALADAVEITGQAQTSNQLYRQLQRVDYVVISSNRVLAGINNLPWRYPVQIRFFESLDSGELGFRLVYEETDFPRLGPIEFDDDSGDEAWLNYDHPHVWIYQKDQLADRPAFDAVFAAANEQTVSPTRYPPDDALMLDQPVDSLPVVSDARWSASLTGNSALAFAVWIGLLVVLQILGWPLSSLLFGRFMDGGWGFARLLSLLLAGYLVWIAASVEAISFRAVWCAVALLAVGLASWGVRLRWRGGRGLWLSRPRRPETAIWAEAVFWVVFGVFVIFRLINPDSWHPIWGGEKPMEFAHLNAILRSAHFPPYDPWFAGGYINYYYYGMYLVAFLFKVTGIPSEIAFNLAQPTIIGLLASGTFSLAATLGRDLIRHRAAAVPAGMVGVLYMVGVGNLTAFTRYLEAPAEGVDDAFGYYTWSGSRAISSVITEFPYFTALYADLHAHVVALPITLLCIALAYAIAKDARNVSSTIVRLPRARRSDAAPTISRLVLLAVALGSLGATNAWDVPVYLALTAGVIFMATRPLRFIPIRLGLAAGLSAFVALITYVSFLPFFANYVALFGSLGRVSEPTAFGQFFSHFGALLSVIALGIITLALAVAPIRGPRWMNPLLVLGMVALVLAIRESITSSSSDTRAALLAAAVTAAAAVIVAASLVALRRYRLAARGVVLLGAILIVIAVALDQLVVGLMVAFLVVGTVVWSTAVNNAARFVGLLITAAAAVVAGTEIVFLADDLVDLPEYRMNTVFKFYNQGWVMLSLAAATLASWMGAVVLKGGTSQASAGSSAAGIVAPPLSTTRRMEVAPLDVRRRGSLGVNGTAWSWAQVGLILTALLIAASLFYPALATGPRLSQRFDGHPGPGTLNALDWMRYGTLAGSSVDGPRQISFADDLAAIDWFNSEVDGSPVIAEASIGPYRGNGSRFSIATGLPTVLGWARHEYQQRYPDGIAERERDVRTLFDSPSIPEKLRILDGYDVSYIVVGDVERFSTFAGERYASAAGIEAFDQMVGTTLAVAYQHGSTTVYRVTGTDQ